MPETAPPTPRRGFRIQGRRVTPGPAPPESWLAASQHAPMGPRRRARARTQSRPDKQKETPEKARLQQRLESFSLLSRLPDAPAPLPTHDSLTHQLLKTVALNWEFLAEFEQYNLGALAVHIKSCLLSYLAVHAPANALNIKNLKLLFYTDGEMPGGTGADELFQMDLTASFSSDLTLNDLTKYLATPVSGDYRKPEQPVFDPDVPPTSESIQLALECWEDEADLSDSRLPSPLRPSRFPNLSRLSLAHAGEFASWSQLLTLSEHLHTVTHLSLAYWPTPSVTPNSKRSFVESRHGNISFGGSHLYSALDEDWYEAANILRRLSKNTYSLEWLDLEGCYEWLPALTWTGSEGSFPDRWVDRTFRATTTSGSSRTYSDPTTVQGPDWNGSWSQIVYVNVSQGSLPRDADCLRRLPAGMIAADLLFYLRNTDDYERPREVIATAEIPQWLEAEKQARKVAQRVRLKRLNAKPKGLFCKFDHGWSAQDVEDRDQPKGLENDATLPRVTRSIGALSLQ
jgi:hypothetical protein